MALAVDPTERERRFFFPGCFWQTTIAIRLLHEAAGPLGLIKKAREKCTKSLQLYLFCQHYIDLCVANTVPADFT